MTEQFDVRAKLAAQHQLLIIVKFVTENFELKKSVAAIILKIAKAIDKIRYEGLIYILIRLNIPSGVTQFTDS